MSDPLCRHCGKPIRKWTTRVYVYREPPRTETTDSRGNVQKIAVPDHVIGDPQTIADCRRLTNLEVVSVQRFSGGIHSFSVWDRESYLPTAGYFCTGTCAQNFARLMARAGHCTTDYTAALARQNDDAAAA